VPDCVGDVEVDGLVGDSVAVAADVTTMAARQLNTSDLEVNPAPALRFSLPHQPDAAPSGDRSA